MSRIASPLRYPGGKSSIFKMVSRIIEHNNLNNGYYAEPYAGGAGLALSLLFSGNVNKIYLNDIDRSIWSFWYSILNHTEEFIDRIREVEITLDEWYCQKHIQENKMTENELDLGFSSFFLNRTNRSGIILKAGPIGGFKQNGNYDIDCRFNKENLIKRILKVVAHKNQIELHNLDATQFITLLDKKLTQNNGLFCIDPPYYEKGESLYTNFYKPNDHSLLANSIRKLSRPWILTYDNSKKIKALYNEFEKYNFNLSYSAADKKKGTELLIINRNIKVPVEMKMEILFDIEE
ncbi:DNA adenine methylase [Pragia fontium]|uniref:DNA adenine methylase n=1 Tax=Pragia fontium DSM 5563 = ATCC 49100 TaxID=1122977 RepID=A0AAJ5BFW8_9GAMM|nr:DNA adenine methylase [Pragia fontium]SFC07557.1 DNA adenine methylase [Pragia fontium DSM 5563 = ATCC 49100]